MKAAIWDSIWCVDFEFYAPGGDTPRPLCVVAHDLVSGRRISRWLDGTASPACPYETGPRDLFISYYASAEIGCHLALGWDIPARIVDLHAEFRHATSGLAPAHGYSLLGAMLHYRLPQSVAATEKKEMRDLAMRGGPYSEEEQRALLVYCESDVAALSPLWGAMQPQIDIPRALLRGRYMAAAAAVERFGIPMDVSALDALRQSWPSISPELIRRVDADYGVFEGSRFVQSRFADYLTARKIPWPTTPTGKLSLSDETFRSQAALYPELQPLRELRTTLSRLKLFALQVGSDGRNRTVLSAFSSKTGRNQPSNTKFIFGPATWVRFLIRPAPGMALAYIDYAQQEFAAAAALSGDQAMLAAYHSGDPYLAFARMAGAVPEGATKKTHAAERDRFKICALAVQYGMGAESLAAALNQSPAHARDLLVQHRRTFPRFWQWVDEVGTTAAMTHRLRAPFGWQLLVTPETKPTTLQNWPCQAAGAEMLRFAVIAAVEHGIRVCAPVHDALLIEAPVEEIEEAVVVTSRLMQEASRLVLHGTTVLTDAKIIRAPDRYRDGRGETIWRLLEELVPALCPAGTPTCP